MMTKTMAVLAFVLLAASSAFPYTESLLTSNDGGTGLGYSVSVDGDAAVAGAFSATVGSNVFQGAAYVFERGGTTWTQTAKLTAPDGQAGDNFGAHVCLDGNYLAVGADLDDDPIKGINCGSVNIFEKEGGVWTHKARLLGSDTSAGDQFGLRLRLQGDLLVVGAFAHDTAGLANSGQAYVFRRIGGVWTETQRLAPAAPQTNAKFGWGLGLDGTVIAVGAFFGNVAGATEAGIVYVFENDGATWSQTAMLTANDHAAYDHFGCAVAVHGDTLVAGADMDDDPVAGAQCGSAYVFTKTGGVWSQSAKLVAADPTANQQIGLDVAIDDDLLLVGAYLADIGGNNDQGAVYVFQRDGTAWNQTHKLVASDGRAIDHYGWAIDISNARAFVGAFLADVAGHTDEGQLYIYNGLFTSASAADWQLLE